MPQQSLCDGEDCLSVIFSLDQKFCLEIYSCHLREGAEKQKKASTSERIFILDFRNKDISYSLNIILPMKATEK